MWENITVWSIIGLSLFFVGRRLIRQWKAALNPKAEVPCGCSCTGCTETDCDSKQVS